MSKTGDRLLPSTADIDESPFPTLEEAQEMSKKKLLLTHTSSSEDAMESTVGVGTIENSQKASNVSDIQISTEKPAYIGHKIPEEFLKRAGLYQNETVDTNDVQSLYKLKSDGSVPGMYLILLCQVFGLLKFISYSRYA